MAMKTLILGGARSGKSRFAESLANGSQRQVIYLATGWAGDNEMATRIAHHQQQRPPEWQTIEEPVYLAEALAPFDHPHCLVLVDCLTLWLSNCLERNLLLIQQQQLLDTVRSFRGDLILVSNEVGSGIVPLGELTRDFVDNSGRLHQQLAALCDKVTLVVAGLPLHLKQ